MFRLYRVLSSNHINQLKYDTKIYKFYTLIETYIDIARYSIARYNYVIIKAKKPEESINDEKINGTPL